MAFPDHTYLIFDIMKFIFISVKIEIANNPENSNTMYFCVFFFLFFLFKLQKVSLHQ